MSEAVAVNIRVRESENVVVETIKRIGAELQGRAFPRQTEVFLESEIEIPEVAAAKKVAIADFAVTRVLEMIEWNDTRVGNALRVLSSFVIKEEKKTVFAAGEKRIVRIAFAEAQKRKRSAEAVAKLVARQLRSFDTVFVVKGDVRRGWVHRVRCKTRSSRYEARSESDRPRCVLRTSLGWFVAARNF